MTVLSTIWEELLKKLSIETLVCIVLALIIALYLAHLNKKAKSDRSAALCRRYALLTEDVLTTLPDNELIRAVVANLMNKLDKKRPDPLSLLPFLSRGRSAVYYVWMFCNDWSEQSLDTVLRSSSARFIPAILEGLEYIGAVDTAEALQTAWNALQEGATTVSKEDESALERAIEAEQPLAKCTDYIRKNPTEFTD